MRIVSGGQAGVDRAALDAAIAADILHGGWCPKGRIAEDGVIPDKYSLAETPSSDYPQRTLWNARDSDATLVVTKGALSGGTAYTVECAKKLLRPHFILDAGRKVDTGEIFKWLHSNDVGILNVAGPRESSCPGIYEKAFDILYALFRLL